MLIDNTTIADLVQREIKNTVNRYVESIMENQQWKQDLEQQIINYVQQRIAHRFQNISTMPDIIDTIASAVKDLFDQGRVPRVDHIVDHARLQKSIDVSVRTLINDSLDNLINDPDWIQKIQLNIENNLVSRSTELISDLDMQSIVAAEVMKNLDRWESKILEKFETRGIHDESSQCEILITDGSVVVQSGLACENLLVEQNLITTDLMTNNLVITGSVNTDCESWNELADTVADRTHKLLGEKWRQDLVMEILEISKKQGIDFKNITVNGIPLVEGDTLNPNIINTSIQKLGLLRDLKVLGSAKISNGTLLVLDRRIGVNTESPDMALAVWDEEVSVSIGKISRDRAWIGSTRQQTMDIGVNRQRSITIEPDGLVSIDRLRLDRWRISFAKSVPNHSGTRGDLVLNHDPKPDTPFAWQCLGGFQWRSINLPCA